MVDQQLNGKRLYYGQRSVFILNIGTNLFEINEPIGWDKILVSLTFDRTLKGFKFEFSDKDVTLEFDTASGFQKLKDIYNSSGVDGQAGLKFGQVDSNNVMTILYEARLDFSTYIETIFTIKLQCERQSLTTKFMSRREADFELEKTETFGGQLKNLPQLAVYKCFLHPPFLNSKASFKYDTNVDPDSVQSTMTIEHTGTPPQILTNVPPFHAISNEIDNLQEPFVPAGELIYAGLHLPNGVVKKNLTVKGSFTFRSNCLIGPFATYLRLGLAVYKKSKISEGTSDFVFNDPILTTMYYYQYFEYTHANESLVFTSHTFDFDITAELLDDEALFIKFVSYSDGLPAPQYMWDKMNTWEMNITNYDFIRPTTYNAYKIKDVLERMFEMVTDQNASFKSDFFTTGLGKDHFTNSGKQLRSIPSANLITSMKSVLPSCDALWNMGGSFERDNFGGEWFRYEPMEYFFRDIEMIKLDIISKYTKVPSVEVTFNEVEFGFKKYPQGNETGSAFDFMTKFNFLTSIQNYKQKLSRICEFLLSPYYISYAIQNSFEVNQTKQFDTDNDIFLISYRDGTENTYTGPATFDAVNKLITIPTGIAVIKGELVTISGTVSNNGIKIVDDIVWDNLNGSVRTVIYLNDTTSIVAEDALASTFVYSSKYVPKRDEQFDTINGVDSPQTVYNLQHHIKIVFKRWAKYFLAGLVYTKDNPLDATVIKYLSSSNNKMVNTTLKITEPQTPMSPVFRADNPTSPDIDRVDERPSDLQYPIFGRSKITFEAPMTWDLLDRLRKAFEGRDPLGKDYGYFSYLAPSGNYEKGYLMDLKFDPNNQNAKIELIEKYNG